MIKNLDIVQGESLVDETLRKYLQRKIGRLDRFMPRRARENALIEIRLKETGGQRGDVSACEVTLRLPHEVIRVSETTVNMYAAIDIVEFKLRQHIRKYKQLHAGGIIGRRLLRRMSRGTSVQDDVR